MRPFESVLQILVYFNLLTSQNRKEATKKLLLSTNIIRRQQGIPVSDTDIVHSDFVHATVLAGLQAVVSHY